MSMRGPRGLRYRVAALRGHRRRDPGGARRHAGRRGPGTLHHPDHPLGEPKVRGGEPRLGQAPQPRPAARSPGWARGAATCWRRAAGGGCTAGGPPFTLSDYRVFVTACLSGGPGPATETVLGAFRRALEGTLASAGAQTRRLEPDALLSLAAELIAPDIGRISATAARNARPGAGRRAILCTNSASRPAARSRSIPPASLSITRTAAATVASGGDIAVRVLSAIAFPEVWPGWRGNALDRRLPPRLPPAWLPGADLPHPNHRRRGGGREGVPQVRPRHPAGRHRDRASTCPACPRRRATGRRSPTGSRTARSWCAPATWRRSTRRSTRSTRPSRRCARSITGRAGG